MVLFSDVELGPPGTDTNGELSKKERELEGTKKSGKNESCVHFVRVSC